MRYVKLFEQFIGEYTITPTEVGRDRGVKLNLKKVAKILKKAGYPATIEKEGILPNRMDYILTGPKYKDNDRDYGSIRFFRNGEVFGDDNWADEINSEDDVIPTIKEFLKDQIEYHNK